jgi:hypothetical protein
MNRLHGPQGEDGPSWSAVYEAAETVTEKIAVLRARVHALADDMGVDLDTDDGSGGTDSAAPSRQVQILNSGRNDAPPEEYADLVAAANAASGGGVPEVLTRGRGDAPPEEYKSLLDCSVE